MEKPPSDSSAPASNNLDNTPQNEGIIPPENIKNSRVGNVLRGARNMLSRLPGKIGGLLGNNRAREPYNSDFTKYAITPSLPDLRGESAHRGPLNPKSFGIKKPTDPDFSNDVAESLDEDRTAGESAASGEAPTRNGPLTGWTIDPNSFSRPKPDTKISTPAPHVEGVTS